MTDETEKRRTIFRVVKDKNNPYVMIDKRPIENTKLSWKAKGILAYLLSRPDDWQIRVYDLINRSPDGAYAVRAAVRELIQAGHIERIYERENGRVKRVVLVCYENSLLRDNQQVENLNVDNREHTNNESTNKESTKKDSASKSTTRAPRSQSDEIFDYKWPAGIADYGATFELLPQLLDPDAQPWKPISKGEYVLWMNGAGNGRAKGFVHFRKAGISIVEMQQAYVDMRRQKLTVKNPNSLYTFAFEIHRKNQANGHHGDADALKKKQAERRAEFENSKPLEA